MVKPSKKLKNDADLEYGATTDEPQSSARPSRRSGRSAWDSVGSNDLYLAYHKNVDVDPDDPDRKSLLEKPLPEEEGQMTTMQATMAFSKQCLGAGILTFAANAYNGGMLSILILLPLSCAVSIFCSIMLVKTLELLEKKNPGVRMTTFEDVAQAVIGRWAFVGTKIVFAVILFFVAIIYVGIPANYLTKLFPEAMGGHAWTWTLIFACVYIPLSWLKSLTVLSKIAVIGVIASALTMAVMVAAAVRYAGSDQVDHSDWDWFPKDHFPNDDNEETGFVKFLVSFSTWSFGFGSILIAPSIRSQMKNKADASKALLYSQSFVGVLYMCFVIPCILGFANASTWQGDVVDLMNSPVVEPTKNKNGTFKGWPDMHKDDKAPFPDKSWEAFCTVFFTIISISVTFPLIMSLLCSMGEQVVPKLAESNVIRIGWRSGLVASAIGLGLILSSLGKFGACIGLLASLFMVPLFFIFPVLLYILASSKQHGGLSQAMKKMGMVSFTSQVVTLVLAVLFLGIGVYGSIKDFVG